MTIGTGTFSPSGKFWFPRSYVYELCIARYGDTISSSSNVYTIHAVPPDPTVAIIVFKPSWWFWTSNVKSLDYVLDEFYALPGGIPPKVALPYALSYRTSPLTGRFCLVFDWFTATPDYQTFQIPHQPHDYWLPMPL